MRLSPPEEASRVSEENDADRAVRSLDRQLAAMTVVCVLVAMAGAVLGHPVALVMLAACGWAWLHSRWWLTRIRTTRLHDTGLWVHRDADWERVPWEAIARVELGAPGGQSDSTPASWIRSILRPVPISERGSRFVVVSLRARRRGLGSRWAIACRDDEAARALAEQVVRATTEQHPFRRATDDARREPP